MAEFQIGRRLPSAIRPPLLLL